MGRNSTRTMAIVRAGGRATAITEGSREFCSVLETVNASGQVIRVTIYRLARKDSSGVLLQARRSRPRSLS